MTEPKKPSAPIRLNLGGGTIPLEGYTNVDRLNGQEVYPLDYDDCSVDEIRASHVLEHFSHTEVVNVVRHWFAKLRPGGILKVAVPDFEWIAKQYLDGKPINVQGYTMGGHSDANDHHGAIFDSECLVEMLAAAGFERFSRWTSELNDCAALEVSLNVQAYKPVAPITSCANTVAVLSAPRFGPVAHFTCSEKAFRECRIGYKIGQGAYWHQVLSENMEEAIEDPRVGYVITCDYDTVFNSHDVMELYRLMRVYEDADAIAALQMKRSSDYALMAILDDNGRPKANHYLEDFQRNLIRVDAAHFGLTIFRAEKLREFPRPWMEPKPDRDGRWRATSSDMVRMDADIVFWRRWIEAGNSVHIASNVPVGHIQELVTWPDARMNAIHQGFGDYMSSGPPEGVWTTCGW